MPPFAQEPWSGSEKLVIGIDIGTTHTAVSYVHLYPGAIDSSRTWYTTLDFLHAPTGYTASLKAAPKS